MCFSSLSVVPAFSLREEDDEDDEENYEDKKDLNHQPAVGGDRLEVFEDFRVSGLDVQLCVLHVGVNPAGKRQQVRGDSNIYQLHRLTMKN